jgi:NADH-quinone oxidoreductase subunit L
MQGLGLASAAGGTTAAGPGWAGLILALPVLGTVLCGICWVLRVRSKLPAWLSVACLGGAFATTVALAVHAAGREATTLLIPLFDWFRLTWTHAGESGSFVAAVGLSVDSLTLLWMLFVTGLGTLITLYSSEYMQEDLGPGYSRFFAGVCIFLVAMSALVMADNLLLLYLGWEGVGFASYWLIGYYYRRPSAVAAAKKAFIMNRIGDLGLALGLYLTWHNFGSIQFSEIFAAVDVGAVDRAPGGWTIGAIPYLIMLGAFGKSAQIPLYVWLPDAMEGPTPVSALIHAATMVTAGVYLLCRLFPLLGLHPGAGPTVAWIGGLTALLAATIGMAQYDMKRIWAYSTVSQLGYMFLGIGVATTLGAAYHVFTHAFFKAVLFLSAGAVMHGFAGQLDVRKVSGLRHMPGWRITSYTMLYACLCLAGLPIVSSGFWSKDLIVVQAFSAHFTALGVIALLTALLTAYYTFRVWFRVCAGPVQYELGEEHHGAGGHDDHHHATPHAPGPAINLVLLLICAGAVASLFLGEVGAPAWVERMVAGSSAAAGIPHGGHAEAGAGAFADPHTWVPWVAGAVALAGIGLAWHFHLRRRQAAERTRAFLMARPLLAWLPAAMEHKWYVDELYHILVRAPLWVLAHVFSLIDRYIVDGLLVDGIARIPRALGRSFQPLQNGLLQSYAVSMAGGAGLVVLLVLYMRSILEWFGSLTGGAG